MTKAICKILYAADAKESPLDEAQELVSRSVDPDMLADEEEWTNASTCFMVALGPLDHHISMVSVYSSGSKAVHVYRTNKQNLF